MLLLTHPHCIYENPLGVLLAVKMLVASVHRSLCTSWQGDFFFFFPGMCKGRIRLLFVEIDCISHKSHFNNLLEARMNFGLERALQRG